MKQFCALFLLSVLPLLATPPDDQTVGLNNGRFWRNTLGRDLTLGTVYLEAMIDGWSLRGDTEEVVPGKVLIVMNSGGELRYDELARIVDAAYDEPENLSLPIGWVAMGCLAVQRGETSRELVLGALRKHLANIMLSPQQSIAVTKISPIDAILNLKEVGLRKPN
jgi:hypothetical protein